MCRVRVCGLCGSYIAFLRLFLWSVGVYALNVSKQLKTARCALCDMVIDNILLYHTRRGFVYGFNIFPWDLVRVADDSGCLAKIGVDDLGYVANFDTSSSFCVLRGIIA